MKDKVFVDNKQIINWIPENPKGDVEGTRAALNLMINLLDEQGASNIIIDLSKAERPDKDQRTLISNALQNNQHNIKKIALFGISPGVKAAAFFIINAAGYKYIKFFDNRAAAEEWLQSE